MTDLVFLAKTIYRLFGTKYRTWHKHTTMLYRTFTQSSSQTEWVYFTMFCCDHHPTCTGDHDDVPWCQYLRIVTDLHWPGLGSDWRNSARVWSPALAAPASQTRSDVWGQTMHNGRETRILRAEFVRHLHYCRVRSRYSSHRIENHWMCFVLICCDQLWSNFDMLELE